MRIHTHSFINALSVLQKVVLKKSAIPVLINTFLLKIEKGNLSVFATDLEIDIHYTFALHSFNLENENTTQVVLHFSSFFSAIKSFKDFDFVLRTYQDHIICYDSYYKYKFPVIREEYIIRDWELSDNNNIIHISLDGTTFLQAAEDVLPCSSKSTEDPQFSGVYLEKINESSIAHMIATNRAMLGLAQCTVASKGDFSCLLPARFLKIVTQLIEKDSFFACRTDNKKFELSLGYENSSKIKIVTSLLNVQFPQYRKITESFPATGVSITGNCDSWQERISALMPHLAPDNLLLWIVIHEGQSFLVCESELQAFAITQVPAQIPHENFTTALAINGDFLLQTVTKKNSLFTLYYNTNASVVKIAIQQLKTEYYIALIMVETAKQKEIIEKVKKWISDESEIELVENF